MCSKGFHIVWYQTSPQPITSRATATASLPYLTGLYSAANSSEFYWSSHISTVWFVNVLLLGGLLFWLTGVTWSISKTFIFAPNLGLRLSLNTSNHASNDKVQAWFELNPSHLCRLCLLKSVTGCCSLSLSVLCCGVSSRHPRPASGLWLWDKRCLWLTEPSAVSVLIY